MHPIAIIDHNTLSGLGLLNLLREVIPHAAIRTFRSFGELTAANPERYAHYFVSAQIYFKHTAFFLERQTQTIVLAGSDNLPQLAGMKSLNICQSEQDLAKSILRLHSHGHPAEHPHPTGAAHGQGPHGTPHGPRHEHLLSAREIEVLQLLVRGLINKEIAERLNISPTTVISHRQNITEKLGIKSVSALTIYAVMHGYVEVDRI